MTTQAGTLPMNTKAITMLFEFTHGVFRRNVEGVTHEESLRAPQPGGNCMNWVGGHLVHTRDAILQMLGAAPIGSPAERERYARGSAPIRDASEAMAWDRIVRTFDSQQEALRAAFAGLTPERLAAPLPAERNPFQVDSVAEQLAVFSFHESYHVGQLGVLRRLCGKPGAIA
jgi:hypothetical protein